MLSSILINFIFQTDAKGRINSLTTVLGQEVDRFNNLLKVIKVGGINDWKFESSIICHLYLFHISLVSYIFLFFHSIYLAMQ